MSTAALFHDDGTGGWSGLDAAASPKAQDEEHDTLARAYAHVFGSPRGERVLADLKATVDVPVGPEYGDAYLRHAEGQRAIVRRIVNMIERGRE